MARSTLRPAAAACLLLAALPLAPALAAPGPGLVADIVPDAPSTQAAQAAPAGTPPLRLAQSLARNPTPAALAGDSAHRRLLDALYTMLDEHPDVLKARAALESAGHDVHSARGARWPTFKVGTSSGNAQLRQSRESYSTINAEVRVSLLDGGAIGAGIRSAESSEAAQTSVLHGTRQNVLLDALTAMLELQRLGDKAGVAAESARIIGQLARLEERRAELGAVGRNDLRQAASRRASALAQQHALEAQRMDAQARFTRYFNFTPESSWLPTLQVPAAWKPGSENAALQASENNSPELQESAQQIERARAELDRSKAQRFPTLAAVVAHTRDPKGVLYVDGTRYGVELNWNLGNGFELRDRILKAVNELQGKEAQQEAVRRQIREAASAAWGRSQVGRERATQLADAVREARSAFEGRRRLLEAGRGSLSQVLDAQLDMQRLMLDEADAIYDQRINELRLVRTTGQLLPQTLPEHWLDPLFVPQKPALATPSAPAAKGAAKATAKTTANFTAASFTAPPPAGRPAAPEAPLRLRLEPHLAAVPAAPATSSRAPSLTASAAARGGSW